MTDAGVTAACLWQVVHLQGPNPSETIMWPFQYLYMRHFSKARHANNVTIRWPIVYTSCWKVTVRS